MNMILSSDYEGVSAAAAEKIAGYIEHHPDALVCFAAGSIPPETFSHLLKQAEQGKIDLSSVYYAGLDEWVGLGPHHKGSRHQVMFDNYYIPAKIKEERIHVFDGLDADTDRQCRLMQGWISSRGGIGLAMLGVDLNGHVGFNEPNLPDDGGCVAVPLDQMTKSVGRKYFGMGLPVEYGISIGLSCLKKAKEMIILADGHEKANIVHKAFCEPVTPDIPASFLQGHPNLTLIMDDAAAENIAMGHFDESADSLDALKDLLAGLAKK